MNRETSSFMRSMALLYASSWILFVILLNHGIITVSSCHVNLEGLVEFGLSLPLDTIGVEEQAKNGEVKRIIESNEAMSSIRHILAELDSEYETFPLLADSTEEELVKIAEDYISPESNSVMRRLLDIVESVLPDVSKSDKVPLFDLAVKPYLDQGIAVRRCNEAMSVQQEIYRMYGIVQMYVIKAYSMILDAYQTLEKFTTNQYEEKKEKTEGDVEDALKAMRVSAISAMNLVPKEIRSCDPKIYIEGETYIELKHLFNTVLFYEPDLSDTNSCSQTCGDYKWINPYDTNKAYALRECSGAIYDCASTPQTHYCPAAGSNRRYDAVSSSNIEECQTSVKEIPAGTSGVYYCDSCACTCDEKFHDDTVRSFSLMEMRSNIAENYVITGLRLVQIRTVICIQIQEGKLQSDGRIVASTVRWQPVDESCTQNYLWMTYEMKSVDLDTLYPPTTQVMTGIRFIERELKLALSIEIDEFDSSSGLMYNKGIWWSNDMIDRKGINIENPASPINADGENIVSLEVDHHVDFTMTDWNKDLSQVAVPFIDAQPVVTNPPLPLSGAGLYYRGRTGYGGFIALKLVTFNYPQLLQQTGSDIFPEPQSCPEAEESTEEETEDNIEEKTDDDGEEEVEEDTGEKTQDDTGEEMEEDAEEEQGEDSGEEEDGGTAERSSEDNKEESKDTKEESKDTKEESDEDTKEAFKISEDFKELLDEFKDRLDASEDHHMEHSNKHEKNHKVDPNKPHNGKDPKNPGGKHPGKPDGKHPDKPSEKHPGRPSEKHPDKPSEKHPKGPSEKHPKRPSEKHPKRPSEKHPKRPSGKHPKRPSGKHPKRPRGKRPRSKHHNSHFRHHGKKHGK